MITDKKRNCITSIHDTQIASILTGIVLLFLCTLSLTGCFHSNKTISKTGFYFDTVITITLYNGDEQAIDKCFEMCEQYEKQFSKTISDSEISQINENSKNGIPTTVSDETIELIQYGLKYSKMSDGAFDITIGALSSLWNFEDNQEGILPDDKEIKTAVSNLGYEQIQINNNEVLITNPNVSIDLGGIAKGYIADKLKEYLSKKGVKNGIINLGGNVLLIGSKPDSSNYNIGIQRPFGSEGDTCVIVNDKDISIVTSGIYERYFYNNNILYHHILDTNTGYPINNNLYSVTIISDTSIEGDGLSTLTFALGLEEGKKFIEEIENVEAIFVDSNETITVTSGLTITDGIVKKKAAIE